MQGRVDAGLHVIIMCKAPRPGRVKTRLFPHYSADEAAEIHQWMAETVIRRACGMFSNVSIATDDTGHPFFKQFDRPLIGQGEGDLGARMARLMAQAFAKRAQAILFLGTDSPHMPELRLRKAVTLLTEYDVVIGPVEDGGYDLIAMNGAHAELFSGITWSSEQVLQESLQRAEASALRLVLLDTSFDLDTPESLERAAPVWSPPIYRLRKYPGN